MKDMRQSVRNDALLSMITVVLLCKDNQSAMYGFGALRAPGRVDLIPIRAGPVDACSLYWPQ